MTIDPVYPQADEDGSCPDALIFIHRLIKRQMKQQLGV